MPTRHADLPPGLEVLWERKNRNVLIRLNSFNLCEHTGNQTRTVLMLKSTYFKYILFQLFIRVHCSARLQKTQGTAEIAMGIEMHSHTAQMAYSLTAVYKSFVVEIGRQLVKAPLAAAITQTGSDQDGRRFCTISCHAKTFPVLHTHYRSLTRTPPPAFSFQLHNYIY